MYQQILVGIEVSIAKSSDCYRKAIMLILKKVFPTNEKANIEIKINPINPVS